MHTPKLSQNRACFWRIFIIIIIIFLLQSHSYHTAIKAPEGVVIHSARVCAMSWQEAVPAVKCLRPTWVTQAMGGEGNGPGVVK